MADQYAGVDAFGMINENYEEQEPYDQYAQNSNVGQHSYSQTVQDLDFQDPMMHNRRYSAVDFDTTQYMTVYDPYHQNANAYHDDHYDYTSQGPRRADPHIEYAARQKIAQLATIARKHEQLLQQQQKAIEAEHKKIETNIYQKVERPRTRKQWVCGTHVLVQRDKSTQWFHGTIVNIYYNAMGLLYFYMFILAHSNEIYMKLYIQI